MVASPVGKQLTSITFDHLDNLTVAGIQSLMQHCTGLASLSVRHCNGAKLADFTPLLDSSLLLKTIKELEVEGMPSAPSQLALLLNGCRSLESLKLTGISITDDVRLFPSLPAREASHRSSVRSGSDQVSCVRTCGLWSFKGTLMGWETTPWLGWPIRVPRCRGWRLHLRPTDCPAARCIMSCAIFRIWRRSEWLGLQCCIAPHSRVHATWPSDMSICRKHHKSLGCSLC